MICILDKLHSGTKGEKYDILHPELELSLVTRAGLCMLSMSIAFCLTHNYQLLKLSSVGDRLDLCDFFDFLEFAVSVLFAFSLFDRLFATCN